MFYNFLIIVFLASFCWLGLKNLKLGIYFTAALLPVYLIRFNIFSLPTTLLEWMIVILFLSWLWQIKKQSGLILNPLRWIKNLSSKKPANYNAVPKNFRLPIVLLILASTIAVFVSPDLKSAAGIWKAYFIEPIMFLLVVVYTLKTPADLKTLIRWLGLPVLAIGIFAIIQKFTGLYIANPFWAAEATRRITTFFGYPNANALFALPIIFLTAGNLLTDKKKLWLAFDLLVLILGILTIIFAKSTGALVGLLVGIILLPLFYKKTRLIASGLIILIILGLGLTPAIQQKFSSTLTEVSQTHLPLNASDLHMRAQMWRETLAMLYDHPLAGAGLAGYQTLMPAYHQNPHVEIYLYPHNFFLNFWTETGLLGLISVSWLLLIFFYFCLNIKTNHKLTLAAFLAMIGLLVHGLVDVPYFKNDLAILFWIIVGVVIIIYNFPREFRDLSKNE